MKYGEKQMIQHLGMLLWDLADIIVSAHKSDSPRDWSDVKYRQEKLDTMRRRTEFMSDCMDATES